MYESKLQKTEGWEDWMGNFITTEFKKVLGIDTVNLYYCWDETQADIIKITSDPKDAINTLKEYGEHLSRIALEETIRCNPSLKKTMKDIENKLVGSILEGVIERGISDLTHLQVSVDDWGKVEAVIENDKQFLDIQELNSLY